MLPHVITLNPWGTSSLTQGCYWFVDLRKLKQQDSKFLWGFPGTSPPYSEGHLECFHRSFVTGHSLYEKLCPQCLHVNSHMQISIWPTPICYHRHTSTDKLLAVEVLHLTWVFILNRSIFLYSTYLYTLLTWNFTVSVWTKKFWSKDSPSFSRNFNITFKDSFS